MSVERPRDLPAMPNEDREQLRKGAPRQDVVLHLPPVLLAVWDRLHPLSALALPETETPSSSSFQDQACTKKDKIAIPLLAGGATWRGGEGFKVPRESDEFRSYTPSLAASAP